MCIKDYAFIKEKKQPIIQCYHNFLIISENSHTHLMRVKTDAATLETSWLFVCFFLLKLEKCLSNKLAI